MQVETCTQRLRDSLKKLRDSDLYTVMSQRYKKIDRDDEVEDRVARRGPLASPPLSSGSTPQLSQPVTPGASRAETPPFGVGQGYMREQLENASVISDDDDSYASQ